MIALSTAWNPKNRIAKTFAAGRKMGFGAFELNGPTGVIDLSKLIKDIEKHDVRISSVHAVCTEEEDIPWFSTWGDWVGDADEDRRREGVRLAKGTLDIARRVGAPAMVIHCGLLPVPDADPLEQTLFKSLAEGIVLPKFDELLRKFSDERRRYAPPYLKALETSLQRVQAVGKRLSELCEYAPDIIVGVETPYHLYSIPHGEEVEQVLDRVGAPNLRYWHDVGHAHRLDLIGFVDHARHLARCGDRMAGMHIHDIRGVRDHLPPGLGDFDFGILTEYLRPDVIRVIEVHSEQSAKAVEKGRQHLAEMYGIE